MKRKEEIKQADDIGFNLFKEAYFGKSYKTRDGRKALYCYKFTDNSHALIIEGDEEFWYVRDDGLVDDFDNSFMDSSYYTDKDIVSEWSDENPDEKMVAKYLYEKKGYPIDLNGHLPSFDETMKDVEKYLKYKQDKFIEKVSKWITENYHYYDHRDEFDVKGLILDLKEDMKGE